MATAEGAVIITATAIKSMSTVEWLREKRSPGGVHQKKGNMSHFTTVKTQIKDIEALRSACAELKLSVLANAEARGYLSNKIKGDYVHPIKRTVRRRRPKPSRTDRSVSPPTCGRATSKNEVGPNYGKLMQLYAVHKATREARKKGHLVKRNLQKDGSIKLVIAGV